MDPNDQLSQNNPYEFIMNPQQPVRRNPFGGGGFLLKIVLILGLGGIIGIGLYIYALTTGSASTSNDTFVSISQQQAEIRRVATAGFTIVRDQRTKNFGTTSALSLTSSQYDLLAFLAKRGVKVENKTLGLKRNPVTDQKLTVAQQASQYDEAYGQVLLSEIKAYQGAVQAAYSNTEIKSEKTLLCGFYNQAEMLVAMMATDTKAAVEKLKNTDQVCGGGTNVAS